MSYDYLNSISFSRGEEIDHFVLLKVILFFATKIKTLGTQSVPSQPTPANKNSSCMIRMPIFSFRYNVSQCRMPRGRLQVGKTVRIKY